MSASLRGELSGVLNPFDSAVVNTAWDANLLDVPAIHLDVYEGCLQLLSRVMESRTVLLYGEAGTGKTHFLNRLRRELTDTEIPFCAVFMHTAASLVWRHLRREMVKSLLQPGLDGVSQLVRVLERHREDVESVEPWSLSVVLNLLLRGEQVRDAKGWLRGDDLPDASLERLGLKVRDVEEEALEAEAREIVIALCRVARPKPMVICLDQVEALQLHPSDPTGIVALGQLNTDIRAHAPNAFLVVCVQTAFIQTLEDQLRAADKDRLLGDTRMALKPLPFAEAEQLIARRLDSVPELRQHPRRAQDRLWPIDAAALRQAFGRQDACIARKAIFRAKELFEQARGGAEPSGTVEQFLEEELARQREAALAEATAERSEEILLDSLPLLLHSRGWNVTGPDPKRKDIALLAHTGRQQIAIAAVSVKRSTAVARRLGRLLEQSQTPVGYRLVLLRDSRLGISATARATLDRIQQVEARGGVLARVSPEALAALEAIRKMMASAESGDLSHHGQTVTGEFVEKWLKSHLPESLRTLLSTMAGTTPSSSRLREELVDAVNRAKVISVAEAARQVGASEEEVSACARESADSIGLLAGRLPALFALVVAGEAEPGA